MCSLSSVPFISFYSSAWPLSLGHNARLFEGTFPFREHLVISVWSRWHRASYHPLRANEKRRRCTLSLDSESPLVHSTQITKLAGSELDLDGRGEEADLICLLTDGSPITHIHLPASHVGMEWPPTARLERAHRWRGIWLLLNMKCRSLGMSTPLQSGGFRRIDLEINRGSFRIFMFACVTEWNVLIYTTLFNWRLLWSCDLSRHLEKLIFATTSI